MTFIACLLFSQIYFLENKGKKKGGKTPRYYFLLKYARTENNILTFLSSVFVNLSQALCVGVI